MRIATFTMIGQYPHGIDLHIRNLKWAITKENHIFIVSLPEIIKDLPKIKGVTYIEFREEHGDFINFWGSFPNILKELNINPEWFLFMEEDIWFHKKLDFIPKDNKEIANYLPLQEHYHAVMKNNKLLLPRIWEGGTLVFGDIIRRAIDYKISFSFVNKFFCDDQKDITLKYFKNCDTFDEFSLYCALVEKVKMPYFDRCVHLRGPETLHRKYPKLYSTCTNEDLIEPAKTLPYLCPYVGIAVYFIDGHWKGKLNWNKMKPEYKKEFLKISLTANQWMKKEEYVRLQEIIKEF